MHPSLLGEEIQAVDILHTKSFSDGKKKRERRKEMFIWKRFFCLFVTIYFQYFPFFCCIFTDRFLTRCTEAKRNLFLKYGC